MLHLRGWRAVRTARPRPHTAPDSGGFYTEAQLRIAQVAFLCVSRTILKGFKEHPLLYSCPFTGSGPASGLRFWYGLCFVLRKNSLYLVSFLSTESWGQSCDGFCPLPAPGLFLNCCIFTPFPSCPGQRALHSELVSECSALWTWNFEPHVSCSQERQRGKTYLGSTSCLSKPSGASLCSP